MQASLESMGPRKPSKIMLVGNWKMHGTKDSLLQLKQLAKCLQTSEMKVVLCLPFTLIVPAYAGGMMDRTALHIGAQDCHWENSGAYTGDISAFMLKDSGASYVLLGHAERRKYHGETNALIGNKLQAALANGLFPILCIGETEKSRTEGKHLAFLKQQLVESLPKTVRFPDAISVAYEPLWAIGTGKTPSLEEIDFMHGFIREELFALYGSSAAQISLLYGGSVKPDNVEAIVALSEVDGVLVGGASLLARDFLQIYDIIKKSLLNRLENYAIGVI